MSGDLSDTPCRGQHRLFESMDDRDHEIAAAICDNCPAFDACEAELFRAIADARWLAVSGGGPCGTWAGRLVGKTGVKPKGRALRARCGSDSGYFRHRRMNEPPCDACKAAHRNADQARIDRRKWSA